MSSAGLASGQAAALELEPVPVPESDRPEVARPIPDGELLAGRYSMESVLAEGGMGVVWLGRHVELDKPVAIKFLRSALCGKDAVVARFLNEARAAAVLRSAHVVRVMDVGQLESGRPYLVMEHLEGIDLDALVERDGPLPVERAVDYMLQVCEALAEAHAAEIVHRDIKPENLFLSHFNGVKPMVKVVDFGLAKRLDGSAAKVVTGPLENMGSPCYMSPEQIEAPRDLDARTDIWSLGVVLYRLLTAVLPFDGDSVTEVCARVLNAAPERLRVHRPDLDGRIEGIVAKCLEKKASERYQTIGELARALERYVEAAVSETRPASVTRSSLRTLAPPKSQPGLPAPGSDAPVAKPSIDEPIGAIPGVKPFRFGSIALALLAGFSIPLMLFAGVFGVGHLGSRLGAFGASPPPLAATVSEANTAAETTDTPEFTLASGDNKKGPLRVTAEREVRAARRAKHEVPKPPVAARILAPARSAAVHAPPKVPEEELTPEEIVRRKMAYEEYLQENHLQSIPDALRQMKADSNNEGSGAVRGKAGEPDPKPDAPRP